jgi:hypothetical protein
MRKRCSFRYRRILGLQTRQDQKRTFPCQIIAKTLSIQNEERMLKATREKNHITYKGKPMRITADISTKE